jgi:predicted enzyme related to lactoylglutathione lyase
VERRHKLTIMEWKLEVVPVPVEDLDRARRFYEEQVGFHLDHDTKISDDVRIVQLTPPGSGCSIVLSRGMVDMAAGSQRGLQLVVSDVDAARETLAANGVEVSEVFHYEGADRVPGRGGRWNSFVAFTDPDGNAWAVQEHE